MNSGGGGPAMAMPSRVQRQVKVGAPGDAAEHEANRAADHVTSGSSVTHPTISRLEQLQRQVTDKRAQEQAPAEGAVQKAEGEQKKDSYGATPVQRAEKEPAKEDAAAGSVRREGAEEKKDTPAVQRAPAEEKKDTPALQRAAAEEKENTPAVQRAAVEEKKEANVQRCCCQGPEEQMQHRASGVASVNCKAKDEAASEEPVRRKTAHPEESAHLDAAADHAISTKDSGTPLYEPTRRTLESRMGVDLSSVRVHEGAAAQESTAALNARAFTHRGDIWLGRGESQDNVHLMAHEVTHVVQQGAAVRRSPDAPKHDEEEKPVVRRSLLGDIAGAAGAAWDATGGKLVDAAGNAIEMGADFFMKLVQKVAPGIVPIFQGIRAKGIVGYLRDKLTGAFNGVFGGLSDGGGFIAGVIQTFSKLVGSASTILGALAHGDCQPLFDAVSQLGDTLKEMAGAAWDRIKEFFAPIGDFFSNLWKKFGAPVVDFLGDFASEVWEDIKALGRQIWDWTQPVRDALSAAWKWVKDQLGIGDEPEGQDGLLQWVQRKLGEAWDWIKQQLQPVIGPMQALVEKVKAIIPLDAILNLRETVHEWLQHAKDMVLKMRNKQGVTQNQEALRDKILPAIKGAIVSLGGKIADAGTWVAGQIGGIASSVTGFFSSLHSNSILGKLASAIAWVQDKVDSLSQWVQGGVTGLFNSIGKGVARLSEFVEPVLAVLKKIVSVVANVVKELPGLVMGPVWKAIPACIRDPIKDFIINNILSQIPIISTFLKIPEIWDKIKTLVMNFLTAVFVNGDLSGAALMVIRFVLEAAGINFDLMLSVLGKAADALDDIIMHPVEFLKNLLGAVKKGFGQFADNILTHLMRGLLEWILGPLKELGVTPPKDFSLGSLLDLALQVLGITSAKLRAKLEKAIGPTAVKILEEAWKWISALITGGFAGLWEQIKSQLSNLYDMVIGGITQWITVSVVKAGIQQLALLSNPVGAVLEAIKTIYTTIQFVVTKMNKILSVVDAVLDSIKKIAAGAIADAANWIESALARTVAPVISFFADWVGIDSPGEHLVEIVKTIQDKVDKALDWLIDKAVTIAKGILNALGLGEKPDDRTPEQKQADLNSAMSEVKTAAQAPDANADSVGDKLPAIRKRYRLKVLELKPLDGGKYDIHGQVNPDADEVIALAPGTIPDSAEPDYGGVSATLGGTSMRVEPLTSKHKGGSAPSSSPGVWDKVAKKREGTRLYVRGHLLNNRLGGPGTDKNLTPITYSANGRHYAAVEEKLIELVDSKKGIVHYEVEVLPPAPAPAPPDVIPEELQLSAGLKWAWWELKMTGGDAQHPQLTKGGEAGSGVVDNVGANVTPNYPHASSGGTVQTASLQTPERPDETVRRVSAKPPADAAPIPTEPVSIESGTFAPPADWQAALKDAKSVGLDVPVRYRKLAAGAIRVHASGPHHDVYNTQGNEALPLNHPALEPLRAVDVHPVLAVSIRKGVVTGYLTESQQKSARTPPQPPSAFLNSLRKNPNAIGWLGMDVTTLSGVQNSFKEGVIEFAIPRLGFRLAGFFNGDASFALNGDQVVFNATATARIPKLDPVVVTIARDSTGHVHGIGSTALKFNRFTGTIQATYKDGQVEIGGSADYKDEKLNGTVHFIVADAATARIVALEHLGPDAIKAAAEEGDPAKPSKAPTGVALAGWGTLTFHFNDWVNGAATVVVDDQGHLTVVGAIRPDKEVPLMGVKPFHKKIIHIPIQAEYGLPYVGGIGLEADIDLDFNSTVGPAKLYNIEALGRYSTDPRIAKEFALSASLNLSAYAALSLTANGSLVITILRHDIKAGAGVTATAGVRGYVDARPTIGYRENLPPEQGGKGEFYFKGHAEVAAQPFLGLEGHLFIELSTPWWSPISDHTWTWPIGSLEYMLAGQFGIGMDVEHVIGSGKVPEVSFSEVSFDSDKFMSDLLDERVPSKTKGEQKVPGKWQGVQPEHPVPPPEPKKVEPPKVAGGPRKAASGRQSPEHRKAADPAVAKAWQKAMADIHALAEESQHHPFGPAEVENAVVRLKKHHRFSDIRVTRAGEDWILHAEMGLRGDFKLKARPTKPGEPADHDDRTREQKQADLNSAMSEVRTAAQAPDATADTVGEKLPAIRKRYRLKVLELKRLDGGKYDIHGQVNPDADEVIALAPGVPDSAEPTYGGVSATLGGTSMRVEPLTSKHKGGSAPSSSPGVWDKVAPGVLKRDGKGLYVRGHLLNRRLGGPGTDQNLTPITYSANGTHFTSVERDIVDLVNSKKGIVHYEVEVLPPAPAPAPPGVIPEELQLSAGLKWAWWELKRTGGDAQHPQFTRGDKGGSDVVPNVGANVTPNYPHA
jgi:hypothetical protein